MAKQMNVPMLVAQHGDKAGFILASLLALVYVLFMIGGPDRGDLTTSQFSGQVNNLRTQLISDDDEQPRRSGIDNQTARQLPERFDERTPMSELPTSLVSSPRPGLEMTVQFEGQKGAPAHDLIVEEAVNQQIHLRWRPSQHGDTAQYRVYVWELGDEGWRRWGRLSRTSSGVGEHRVDPGRHRQTDDDGVEWIEYVVEGVTDNVRYGVLVHSIDGQGNEVSYRGNPEGQEAEDNYDEHGVAEVRNEGLYAEVTPAGQRLGVPEPTNVRVLSQSLAGVRLAWNNPLPSENTVDLRAVRVQLWRWEAENPDETRTLLTPITQERHDGWRLGEFNGEWTDHEIDPDTEYIYAIRLYHVGVAYPPLNRTGRARRHGVSHSAGIEVGTEEDVIRAIAYIGDVITIKYPQRDERTGEYLRDRQDDSYTLLDDETFVYASDEIIFDMSALEEGKVKLHNRPLVDVIRVHPGDQHGRSPQIGSAEVHITKYFRVRDPDDGEEDWERFGATFIVEGQLGGARPIGGRARPETAGPRGEPIDEFEGGRWRNAVGQLDFSTTLVVIGFYSIGYRISSDYDLEYVEFYDIGYRRNPEEEERWPFKVYPPYQRERREIQEYMRQHDFGRNIDQALELYSRYKREIEYPTRAQVVAADRAAEYFVRADMQGRLEDWMFEWEHEPRMSAIGEEANEPPMWQFSLDHGVRFFPRSWLTERRRRDSLDPDIDLNDIETWHNEVRRLQVWAHRKLEQRFQEMLDGLEGDELPEEFRDFTLTTGFNEVAVPMMLQFIAEHEEREVVIEMGELIFESMREHHGIHLGRPPTSISETRDTATERITPLVNDLYGAR